MEKAVQRRRPGQEPKKSAKKIENGKGANAKTYLIGCQVDAAPIEVEKLMKTARWKLFFSVLKDFSSKQMYSETEKRFLLYATG